jgi:hypothetical protein
VVQLGMSSLTVCLNPLCVVCLCSSSPLPATMRSAANGLSGHAASASASTAAVAAAAIAAAPAAPAMTTPALPPVLPASIVAACAPFAGGEAAYYEGEEEQRWRLRSIYLPADSKGLVSVLQFDSTIRHACSTCWFTHPKLPVSLLCVLCVPVFVVCCNCESRLTAPTASRYACTSSASTC